MKLYAQHGYGPGDKLSSGLSAGVLDGVVLGAKDTSGDQIDALITGLRNARSDADILFDPHYYASILPRDQDYRLGNLKSYPYWGDAARNDLFFLDQANVGYWGAMEHYAELRILLQIRSAIKSGVTAVLCTHRPGKSRILQGDLLRIFLTCFYFPISSR